MTTTCKKSTPIHSYDIKILRVKGYTEYSHFQHQCQCQLPQVEKRLHCTELSVKYKCTQVNKIFTYTHVGNMKAQFQYQQVHSSTSSHTLTLYGERGGEISGTDNSWKFARRGRESSQTLPPGHTEGVDNTASINFKTQEINTMVYLNAYYSVLTIMNLWVNKVSVSFLQQLDLKKIK